MMRALTPEEIIVLQQQGCTAGNWEDIRVAEGFSSQYVRNVSFSGNIELGAFNATFSLPSGMSLHSGITNATLHNCKIGDDCLIRNIGEHIANYSIGNHVFISDVALIETSGECSFGNGVSVTVVNEGGGRDIPICDCLSTQVAYYMAMFRNRTDEVNHLMSVVGEYADTKVSTMGRIDDNATIRRCKSIVNVNIGKSAELKGCTDLENGTVCSTADNHTVVGADVVARNFIIQTGAEVTDGAQIERCYVGEGSQVGEQFAATDCFISCNCQFFHGEAASIFAGPYSVSHHKATLLIAGLFSFMNAGSASNQSNHAYKLGPNHQGILERGCKLASSSYLLWPAHLGTFTTVLGCHKEHPNTTRLPFSYLVDNQGKAFVVPGANLKSVGTMRDADKWPKRDCRSKEPYLDNISFNLLNPITVAQILNGIETLEGLLATDADVYEYNGLMINESAVRSGLKLYSLAIDKYKGEVLLRWMSAKKKPETTTEPIGNWVDLGGMILPYSYLDNLTDFNTLIDINDYFCDLNERLTAAEMQWAGERFPDLFDAEQARNIMDAWYLATSKLTNLALDDAKKEFSQAAMLGYGLDDCENSQTDDFMALRGEYEENSFVKALRWDLAKTNEIYNTFTEQE